RHLILRHARRRIAGLARVVAGVARLITIVGRRSVGAVGRTRGSGRDRRSGVGRGIAIGGGLLGLSRGRTGRSIAIARAVVGRLIGGSVRIGGRASRRAIGPRRRLRRSGLRVAVIV